MKEEKANSANSAKPTLLGFSLNVSHAPTPSPAISRLGLTPLEPHVSTVSNFNRLIQSTISLAKESPVPSEDLSLFYSYAFTKLGQPFTVEPKYDGVRCLISLIPDDVNPFTKLAVIPISRAGRRFTSLKHICLWLSDRQELVSLINQQTVLLGASQILVLDCELIADGLTFKDINGLANRKASDQETARLKPICFQAYFIDTASHRLKLIPQETLDFMNSCYGLGLPLAPRKTINSLDELSSHVSALRSAHAEGLVAKPLNPHHVPVGRSGEWIKLKFRRTGTFKLINVIAGSGKCYGMAGAIKIEDAEGNTSLVGTGFTDAERRELISLDLNGGPYYVEISYMTKTGASLREPVYLGIRYDLVGHDVKLDRFTQR